jgi:hypothetical protein
VVAAKDSVRGADLLRAGTAGGAGIASTVAATAVVGGNGPGA